MAVPEFNEKFMALADIIGDSLVLLQDFKIVYANQALCRVFCCTLNDVLGSDYREFLKEEDRQASAERIARLQRGEIGAQQAYLDLPDTTGRIHRMLLREAAVIHDGRPAVLVVARELSEENPLPHYHGEIRSLLEKGSRLSALLLRALQAELQEPLASLTEMARQLQDHDHLPETLHRRLQAMTRTGSSLELALERVKRQALASSEALRLVAEEFSAERLLKEVADLLAARAELRGLSVATVLGEGAERVLCTDRDALCQLLSLLAGQALECAAADALEFHLEHPAAAITRFRISYRGEPLPENFQRQLEQPLLREDDLPQRLDGQGISRACLCGSLARELGGRLVVERQDQRTSIWLDLGRGPQAARPASRADIGASGERSTRKRDNEELFDFSVLVVDDDATSREVTATILRRLGCRVTMVNDGGRALSSVRDGDFQVVFMDCRMPGLDGFQTTRQIRRLQETGAARVYIVALTAHCLEQDRHLCLEAGMDDHLAKPAGIDDFRRVLRRVRRHLSESAQRAKL